MTDARALSKSGFAGLQQNSGGLGIAAPWPATTTWGVLAISIVLTGVPVYFHLAGQAFGIAAATVLSLIVVTFAASAVPSALIFAWIFQNLFVAFVSPQISDLDAFNKIRAYNFLFTVVVWIVVASLYWISRRAYDRHLRTAMDLSTTVLVLIGFYFLIGFPHNPASAASYLRNIATPFFLFQIFALIAYRYRISVTRSLMIIAGIAVIYGYVELIAHDTLFPMINADDYLRLRMTNEVDSGAWVKEMQKSGLVIRSYLDTMRIDFLNTPLLPDLGWTFYRLVGPNFHSISFAYTLAVLGVFLAAAGVPWFVLLSFPLLLVIGSKGALIFTIFLLIALMFLRWVPSRLLFWSYIALLAAYTTLAILTGIWAQDYHVIGFFGGLRGFLAQPIGHGLGVGGNLSMNMTGINWSRSQHLGYTDVAVESAVGVILYQMGIFGFAVLGMIVWIAMRLWAVFLTSRERVYAIGALALITIAVNGIFQEEALFSPAAFGFVIAFAGLLIGRSCRPAPGPVTPVRQR